MSALGHLWRHHRLALVALVLALALAAGFGLRAVVQAVRFADPALRVQPIAGWMTPGFVARVHDIPRAEMLAALGLDAPPPRGTTLEDLAAAEGIPLAALIARIEAAIAAPEGGR